MGIKIYNEERVKIIACPHWIKFDIWQRGEFLYFKFSFTPEFGWCKFNLKKKIYFWHSKFFQLFAKSATVSKCIVVHPPPSPNSGSSPFIALTSTPHPHPSHALSPSPGIIIKPSPCLHPFMDGDIPFPLLPLPLWL